MSLGRTLKEEEKPFSLRDLSDRIVHYNWFEEAILSEEQMGFQLLISDENFCVVTKEGIVIPSIEEAYRGRLSSKEEYQLRFAQPYAQACSNAIMMEICSIPPQLDRTRPL